MSTTTEINSLKGQISGNPNLMTFESLMLLVNAGQLKQEHKEYFDAGFYTGTMYKFFNLNGEFVTERWSPSLFN